MTKRKVWRYKCDFCGKSGCSGGHISRHETSCTANPNRICRLHQHCEKPQPTMMDMQLIIRLHVPTKTWKMATDELRSLADGCPNCILAAIRQSGLAKSEKDENGWIPGADFEFDYKAECKAFWDQINEDAAEQEAAQARYGW